MRSALITIGDEILIGQVTDTNSVWIARRLSGIGVEVGEMLTVPDDPEQISGALDRYVGNYGLVILTGGLGPTRDDRTKQTLAEYFDSRLVRIPEVLDRITRFFEERGRTLIDANIRQADVPEICTVLMNSQGTAPGMWFEKEGTIVVSLPGVPYEMKALMGEEVLPRIRTIVTTPNVVHRTIMTQGVPESYLAEILENWESSLPDCVKLAYLPRPGIVRLRLTVTGSCAGESQKLLDGIIGQLLEIIPEHVFGYDDIPLEQALGDLLRENGVTVATAESCTGGDIARLITSVPGSSSYFLGSVVAYHNAIKTGMLGVGEHLLAEHGAVSREVVEAMARGVRERFNADTAIATSGIAGPDGGTPDKPVGTTWICVLRGDHAVSRKYSFGGSRDRIVSQASITALQLLRRLILKQFSSEIA